MRDAVHQIDGEGPPEAIELLTANLPLIERAIRFACRRYRLSDDDAEEFASVVKLRLVEKDYAILRTYERRATFATFISVVVQRMALDYRIHEWGKWHTSAEANRLGPLAVELERLLHRDGRTMEEALVALSSRHGGVTPESLEAIANRFPERAPRPHGVDLDDARSVAGAGAADVEEPLMARERQNVSERLSAVIARAIAAMPEDDRLMLQLRFEGGMAVSQIARSLRIDQKLLYRRFEKLMRDMRVRLERSGVPAREALELIGRDESLLDFRLGNSSPRPSIRSDEQAATHREASQ